MGDRAGRRPALTGTKAFCTMEYLHYGAVGGRRGSRFLGRAKGRSGEQGGERRRDETDRQTGHENAHSSDERLRYRREAVVLARAARAGRRAGDAGASVRLTAVRTPMACRNSAT